MLHYPETAIVLAVAKWVYRPTVSRRVVTVSVWLILLASIVAAITGVAAGRQARIDEAVIAAGRTRDGLVVEKRQISDGLFGPTYRLSMRYIDLHGGQRADTIDVDPATFARATTGASMRIAFPDERGNRIIVADAALAAVRARDMGTLVLAAVIGAICACAGLFGMSWWRAAR